MVQGLNAYQPPSTEDVDVEGESSSDEFIQQDLEESGVPPVETSLGVDAPTAWEALLARLLLKDVSKEKVSAINDLALSLEEVKNLGVFIAACIPHLDKIHVADMGRVELLKTQPDTILDILSARGAKQSNVYGADFHIWCFRNKYIKVEIREQKLVFSFGPNVYIIPDDGFVDQKKATEFLAGVSALTGKFHYLIPCSKELCDAAYAFTVHTRIVESKESIDNMKMGLKAQLYTSVTVPGLEGLQSKMKSYLEILRKLVANVNSKARPNTNCSPIEWFCKLIIDNGLNVPKHPFSSKGLDLVANVPFAHEVYTSDGKPKNYKTTDAIQIIDSFDTCLFKAREYRLTSPSWNNFSHDWATPAHAYGYMDKYAPSMKFAETVSSLVTMGVWKMTDSIVVIGDPAHFEPIVKGLGLTPRHKTTIGYGYQGMVGWTAKAVTSYDSVECHDAVASVAKGAWVIQAVTQNTSDPSVASVAKGSDYVANKGLISRLCVPSAKGVLLQIFVERNFLVSGRQDLSPFMETFQVADLSRPWRQHNADYIFFFWNGTNNNNRLEPDLVMTKFLKKLALLTTVGRRYSDIRNVALYLGLPGLPAVHRETDLSPAFGEFATTIPAVFTECIKTIPPAEIGKKKAKAVPIPVPNFASRFEEENIGVEISLPKAHKSPARLSAPPQPAREEGEVEEEPLVPRRTKEKEKETIASKKAAPAKKKAIGAVLAEAATTPVSSPAKTPPKAAAKKAKAATKKGRASKPKVATREESPEPPASDKHDRPESSESGAEDKPAPKKGRKK